MRAKGNGAPEACALNLLRTVRGEVPFERIKGIDGSLIDRPVPESDVISDIESILEIYEPRIDTGGIDMASIAANLGEFGATVEIRHRREESGG